MLDKDFYKKQLEEHLRTIQNEQSKYGHLTAYEYLENKKLEMIKQYEILIDNLSNTNDL